MANNDIIELLDILYGMVTEAWSVPLGNDKCIIEREKAVEIINEIKANLPTAIAEAQRLVAARDEFIGNAKREAEALRKNAEEQAHLMIEEQEVVRVARQRSSEMISAAENKSKELRRVASEYVDDLMRQTEQSMSEALATIRGAHQSFQALGGGIAAQSVPQPAPQAKQSANQAKQPAPQTKQSGSQAKPSANQRRQPEAPQGKPDPLSSKIHRIDRDGE